MVLKETHCQKEGKVEDREHEQQLSTTDGQALESFICVSVYQLREAFDAYLRALPLSQALLKSMNDVYHIYIKAKKEQGIKLSMQYDHNYAKENYE